MVSKRTYKPRRTVKRTYKRTTKPKTTAKKIYQKKRRTTKRRSAHKYLTEAERVMCIMQPSQRSVQMNATQSNISVSGSQSATLHTFYAPAALVNINPTTPANAGGVNILFEKCYGSLRVQNATSVTLEGEVYHVMARGDYSAQVPITADGGVTYTAIANPFGDPLTAWNDPINGMPAVGAGAGASNIFTSANVYGATPFMSPLLCSKYKIKKVEKIKLKIGESKDVRIKLTTGKFNTVRIMENGTFGASNAQVSQLRGWTYSLLVVLRGIPADLAGAVSSSILQAEFISKQMYEFKFISTNAPTLSGVALSTAVVGATTITPSYTSGAIVVT